MKDKGPTASWRRVQKTEKALDWSEKYRGREDLTSKSYLSHRNSPTIQYWDGFFYLLMSTGNDFMKSIPPAYVA
jgi:hypothetical protein